MQRRNGLRHHKRCSQCNQRFTPKYWNAETCSPACRKRKSRLGHCAKKATRGPVAYLSAELKRTLLAACNGKQSRRHR